MILQTFIDVFKSDLTSVYSQTLLRLIARMIKERKFQVHPNILSCLLHLRLRSELDMMREKAKKDRDAKGRDRDKRGPKEKSKGQFKSEIRKKWQTKNQKKREKEMKEVEKEMGEAAAEVDLEERAGVVSGMFESCESLADEVANGNTEKLVCPLLFHSQEPNPHTPPSSRFGGYFPFRPFHQCRFLPRLTRCSAPNRPGSIR